MKKLSLRKNIVSWDEQPEIEGVITEFSETPFEVVGLQVDNEIVYKPIGYANLDMVRNLPIGTHVRIIRGDKKKNKKTGRSFYNFDVYVDDDFNVESFLKDLNSQKKIPF